MGWEHEKNHAGCPGEIMHTYQNYKTVCPCECHGSENETNNENSKARRKVGAWQGKTLDNAANRCYARDTRSRVYVEDSDERITTTIKYYTIV